MLLLAGCGGGTTQSSEPNPPVSGNGTSFAGKVLAGTQPVVGSSVQLYAAGTAGNGSAGTALLTTALTTDAKGSFTVPSYTCPASGSLLYAIARGGQVGTGAPNSAITLITPIGACSSISTSTQIVIDEATTVAAAWALSQFMSAGGNIGATSTNTQGIANAFATAASLVDPAQGTSPGATFPTNGQAPTPKINSLANLLNACVVASSSAAPCSQFFGAATNGSAAPANTLDAALNLVRNPGSNVAALYGLASASAAYVPALAKAPSDWTLFIAFSGGGMNQPSGVAIDSSGNVWVASYFKAVSEFSPIGKPVFANGITGYGLQSSYGIAIDSQNNIWVPNEDSPQTVNNALGSVTELNSSGQPLSGQTGFSQGGLNYPASIAIDTTGVSWVVDYGNSHVTLLSSSGQPLSGTSGYAPPDGAGSGFAFPVAIAVDSNRVGWVANEGGNFITRMSADGTQFTNIQCCDNPEGLAIDQHGYVWVSNYYGDSVSQISSSNNAVVSAGYNGGGLAHPVGIAIDGAGSVWVANFRGPSLSQLAGSASNTPGNALSPSAGWAPDAGLLEAYGIAIDASGNVWVTNFGNNTLTEFVGLAGPLKTPVIGLPQAP